ncbi:MAG: DUF58 domain-containing protein [Planctomycetota bacterium]
MATEGTTTNPGASSAPRSAASGGVDASLYLHPQTLARLGSFELRAKMIVEGVMSGMHRSPYQGFSVEFAQHRPYSPGDDVRHLDWKVFARTDKLQIKQYQQETNLDLVCLVDASGSMNYGSRSFADASGVGRKTSLDGRVNWTKFDHATGFAAAMSYITLRQGDRTGLIVFADEISAMVSRSSQRGTWRQIVEALATHPVDRPTDIRRVIDQTLSTITNRALIVLISDLFEDIESIRQAMARVRHRGHDLIAFQILDRSEREFDFKDAAPFRGFEGEAPLRVDPRALRPAYLAAINEHIEAVGRTCRAFGFDHEIVSTHDWLGPPLAAFVARRNAAFKRLKQG